MSKIIQRHGLQATQKKEVYYESQSQGNREITGTKQWKQDSSIDQQSKMGKHKRSDLANWNKTQKLNTLLQGKSKDHVRHERCTEV